MITLHPKPEESKSTAQPPTSGGEQPTQAPVLPTDNASHIDGQVKEEGGGPTKVACYSGSSSVAQALHYCSGPAHPTQY
ncbi:hypothetical protein V2J09_022964 [Rumex salicifolius]